MTSIFARIRSWESNHLTLVWWIGAVFRSLVGLAAIALGIYALVQSIDVTKLSFPFVGWSEQSLRDFSVLMFTYALLCFIQHSNRSFIVDGVAFVVSFLLWAVGFVLWILDKDPGAFSFAAVVVTIVFLVTGPVLKGDAKTIWHDYPTAVPTPQGASPATTV